MLTWHVFLKVSLTSLSSRVTAQLVSLGVYEKDHGHPENQLHTARIQPKTLWLQTVLIGFQLP